MADTLVDKTAALQTGVTPVATLEGSAGSSGQPGSGLSGAASLTVESPLGNVGGLVDDLGDKLTSALSFDVDKARAPVAALDKMKGGLKAPPAGALKGFGIKMEQTEAGLSQDFPTAVAQTVDRLNGIFAQVPTDPSTLVSTLLEKLVEVFASLDGPEAEQIRAWIATVEEIGKSVLPLIEAADADARLTLAVDLVGRSVTATASVFGFDKVASLVASLDAFLHEPLPSAVLSAVEGAFSTVDGALGDALAKGDAELAELRAAALAALEDLRALKDALRSVLSVALRVADAPILKPGALQRLLADAFDHALGAKVGDVSNIDDPYKSLLDRIDAAIAAIDLSTVRTQVLDGLHALRDAIASANLAAIGDVLRDALEPVTGVVDDLESGVTGLLDDLRGYLHDAAGEVHTLAESVGEFAPDGSFQFAVEDELHDALGTARTAIAGDPADPSTPSVAGTLRDFKLAIDDFLDRLTALLEPVGDAIDDATTTVVGAITDFAAFVEQLDVKALLDELKGTIDEIVHELTPIDFAELADPVIAGLEENTEKIKAIDASKLNDLLRQALSAALDLIIAIDFTETIRTPLEDELDKVKKLPEEAIAGLQARYEEALGVIDQLSPAKLLAGLFDAFDVLKEFTEQLDASKILDPLDDLYESNLVAPLGKLKPSVLLKPLEDAFGQLTAAVASVSGAQLMAPAQQGLSELKAKVAGLDLTSPLDFLTTELDRLEAELQKLKPSTLLAPIVADLERLDTEIEKFRPSKVFEPVTALAAPLLDLVQAVQQETVEALHAAFQAPLAVFERIEPQKLATELQNLVGAVIAAIEKLKLPARVQAMSQQHAQLKLKAEAAGGAARAEIVVRLDVQFHLGPFVAAHDKLLVALKDLKRSLTFDDLTAAYAQLEERVLGLLPPFARQLLSVEDFKRVMALASPLRFLTDLDARFDALKAKLLPITPQEIVAELDAAHAEVLTQIGDLGLDDRLAEIKATIERLRSIITGLRIDFVAGELDTVLADLRAVVDAFDPARLIGDLDAIHAEVVKVVEDAKPSLLLGDVQEPLDAVKEIVASVDPRAKLLPPIEVAWKAIEDKLAEVDFGAVLSPIGARLDELEDDFEQQLGRTEKAFDDMLRAAKGVLKSAPPSATAGVSF